MNYEAASHSESNVLSPTATPTVRTKRKLVLELRISVNECRLRAVHHNVRECLRAVMRLMVIPDEVSIDEVIVARVAVSRSRCGYFAEHRVGGRIYERGFHFSEIR